MPEDLSTHLNLTPEERRLYGHLFRQADSEGIGVVTGEIAVKFFDKTRLEPRILGEIWQIADKENRGLLTPAGFSLVLRLIGHCQAGREPTPELALRPGPLPKFEHSLMQNTSPTVQSPTQPSLSALQPQPSGSGPIRVPPLTPDKARQYSALFDKSGAQNGVLPGEQAKQIFERAGLPNEILGQIWNLADTELKGALQVTEFIIAMHLIASFKTGQLRALPSALPFGLYEAASRPLLTRSTTGNSIGLSSIQKQLSGTPLPNISTGRVMNPQSPQIQSHLTGSSSDWAISASDKYKFDSIYNTLDKINQGFITGNEAVPFFSESKLPEEVLAQIWDLADINSAGRLSKDEFAVAMYLIRQQRGKRDGRDSLPERLPANLIPPSMRNQEKPTAVSKVPVFDAPLPKLAKPAAEDLFGLDALSSNTTAQEQTPQPTGSSMSLGVSRDTDLSSNASNSSKNQVPNSSLFKPFLPSSSFGQSVSRQVTGGRDNSPFSLQGNLFTQASQSEDLLGDNDPVISSKLTNETSELANLSNQVGSLSKKVQDVEGQRAQVQNDLVQAGTQKQKFEARLAQLRLLYEKELNEVRILEERLNSSRKETNNLKNEFNILQESLEGLQNDLHQTTVALQADQTENFNLKERIREVNAEIALIRPALEKFKSEARQQKGLAAINKKQLLTNEAERDRLRSEVKELEEKTEMTKTFAIQGSGEISSPAPSTLSAKNPFFRRETSGSADFYSYFTGSTPEAQQSDRTLMNVFGPAHESVSATGETPTLTFKEEKRSSINSIPPTSTEANKLDITKLPNLSVSTTEPKPIHVSAKSPGLSSSLPNLHEPTPTVIPIPINKGSISSSIHASVSSNGSVKTLTTTDIPVSSKGIALPNLSTSSPFNIKSARDDHDQKSSISLAISDTTSEAFPFSKASERSGSAKDDFDSAFASFGSTPKIQEPFSSLAVEAKATSVISEFPPIAELDNNDSESDSEGVGFDDDFAPVSPSVMRGGDILHDITCKEASEENPRENLEGSSFPSSNLDKNVPSAAPGLPSIGNNLHASDEDKLKSHLYISETERKKLFESSPSTPLENASKSTSATETSGTPPKISTEDSVDDFDGLEDAREGDSEDEFTHFSSNYRPSFDNNKSISVNTQSTVEIEPSQKNSSIDFKSQLISNPVAGSDNHDWDAIFSGLESSEVTNQSPKDCHINEVSYSEINTRDNSKFTRLPSEAELPDDPILKKLIELGYQRIQALDALEKYDYNLERAADYLANQS